MLHLLSELNCIEGIKKVSEILIDEEDTAIVMLVLNEVPLPTSLFALGAVCSNYKTKYLCFCSDI